MSGGVGYDLAHLLGGLVLLLSFGLAAQRRTGGLIGLYAWQAGALAAAAAWQGWTQDVPGLYATAALTLAVKAVAIPAALRRVAASEAAGAARRAGLWPFSTAAASVVAVALATPVRDDLLTALWVVVLGLLTMIAWRSASGQVIGFLSLANGLVLAALGAVEMPLVVELSLAVLMLEAFAVSALRLRVRAA